MEDSKVDYLLGDKDPYISNMKMGIREADNQLEHVIVKRVAVDVDGHPIGKPSQNNNPLTDSHAYELEFIDGCIKTLTTNIIAKNLLAQIDEKGHQNLLLDKIEEFWISELSKEE